MNLDVIARRYGYRVTQRDGERDQAIRRIGPDNIGPIYGEFQLARWSAHGATSVENSDRCRESQNAGHVGGMAPQHEIAGRHIHAVRIVDGVGDDIRRADDAHAQIARIQYFGARRVPDMQPVLAGPLPRYEADLVAAIDHAKIGAVCQATGGELPAINLRLRGAAARDRVATQYAARLGSAVKTPATLPDGVHAWGIYSILLASEAQRTSVQAAMQARGVPSAIYYPRPLHHQPAYATAHAACLAGGPPALPVSEDLCQRILCLPMHPYLDAGQVDRVADAVLAGL